MVFLPPREAGSVEPLLLKIAPPSRVRVDGVLWDCGRSVGVDDLVRVFEE